MTSTSPSLLVSQLAKQGYRQLNPLRIFLQVKAIINAECGNCFAYGIDLNTEEIIKIRLNHIDEGVEDLIQLKNINKALAIKQVKSQYSGANSRDSLQIKRDQYHAAYLCFDRCIEIPSNEYGIKAYRSHWAELMSADPQAEVFLALAHVHRQTADKVSQSQKTGSAWTEMIETVQPLCLNHQATHYQQLLQALAPQDEIGRAREAYVVLQVYEETQLQSEIKIFQHRQSVTILNERKQPVQILQAVTAQDTLNYYFNEIKAPTNPQFNISRDIARIILNIFYGQPIQTTQFSCQRNDYLISLRQLYQRFKDQQLTVRMITVRTILFGPYKMRSLLASNPQKGPLSLYRENLFLPTALVIQRYPDSGRAYGVFALPSEQIAMFKPCTLSTLPIAMAQYRYRHIIADEWFDHD